MIVGLSYLISTDLGDGGDFEKEWEALFVVGILH